MSGWLARLRGPAPAVPSPQPSSTACSKLPLEYEADGLKTWSKQLDFLTDERFLSAYNRGASGYSSLEGQQPLDLRWRVSVTCWAAFHGSHLPGDFVECGVNTGWHSLAICEYVNFNSLGKKFYLFDTFCGLPPEQMSSFEATLPRHPYRECYELAVKNFSPFPNAKLVRGKVPDTLRSVEIGQVAYLSIDMNLAHPEKAALEYFWPKMVSGAICVFDDYAWVGMHEQKQAHDAFAAERGLKILTLPTAQGLLIKP
jgi:O-methyltransferase